ncbi:MAG TPA: ComEA family DNA-binding protein [Leptolyngbyaceae cyanobacterium M33_DOE_097]|uniref:ComEA family DNA-binding protein n=1 Tax=Oscillatoriales cyanobacterium SpSt-418 TaxID=2282169 RepID=A0A7C3KEY7_9CYAN|nr:ComEA family DNA-binding protein [Leptolyngbyaceae cyanobacterium M33_DOE_097]
MVLRNWLSTTTKAVLGQSLAAKIKNDPFYRFQTIEELQIAAQLGISIDANQATVDDWLRLPGISIHQARALVELTHSGVQFHAIDDIAAVLGVSVDRLKPLQLVLRFCYYDPESVCTVQPVNVNTASLEMLLKVPKIDLHLARAIVAHRTTSPYRNLPHLQKRLSLPPTLTAELMHYLRF